MITTNTEDKTDKHSAFQVTNSKQASSFLSPTPTSQVYLESILQSMPNNIFIFDLGGVLLECDYKKVLRETLPKESNPYRYLEPVFKHKDWDDFHSSILSYEDFLKSSSQRSELPVEIVRNILEKAHDELKPHPIGMLLFNISHSMGKTIYCLSNISQHTLAYLKKKFDFLKKFSGIVISGQVKMRKPNRDIYLHLFEKYNVNPYKAVFFDDSLENIKMAKSLGMKTVLFKNDLQQIIEELQTTQKTQPCIRAKL